MTSRLLTIFVVAVAGSVFAGPLTEAQQREVTARVMPSPEQVRRSLPEGFFPVGIFHADGDYLTRAVQNYGDDRTIRRDKLFTDLLRYGLNTVLPANSFYSTPELDQLARYHMYAVLSSNDLNNVGIDEGKDKLTAADPAMLARVGAAWQARVNAVKNHPALLAWHIYDEPLPWFSKSLRTVRDAIQAVDPAHPVVYTHSNAPLGSDADEYELLASSRVIYSDYYSINQHFDRDPWGYGDIMLREFKRANPNADYWPTIQSYAWNYTPTAGELRVMIWHTLACGAKGMFYFTTGQDMVSWPTPDNSYYPHESPGNLWFAGDWWLEEIGRANRLLDAAGPLLVPLRYFESYPYRDLSGEKIHRSFATTESPLRRMANQAQMEIPVLHIGAFAGDRYDILVIHNDDPDLVMRTVDFQLEAAPGRDRLYDLRTLQPVSFAPGRESEGIYRLTFIAGDGGLYFRGSAEDFASAAAAVGRRRAAREQLLFELELAIAAANGVDADGLIRSSAMTVPELREARRALAEREKDVPDYRTVKRQLELLRRIYADIDAAMQRFAPYPWTAIPDRYPERIVAETVRFVAFENAFRLGQATPETGAALLDAAEQLRQELPDL